MTILLDRIGAFAELGRANGPKLRELADDLDELRGRAQELADAIEELTSAADDYESAEEGRDGIDDRAAAWDAAQDAATTITNALDDLMAELGTPA